MADRDDGPAVDSGAASSSKTDSASSAPDASLEGLPFEAALARLEEIVDRLEGGDLELEEALAAFESGVRLTAHCAGQLEDAQGRIDLLVQQGGAWIERPFEDNAEDQAQEAEDDEDEWDDED